MKLASEALGPNQILITLSGRLDIQGAAEIETAFSAVASHATVALVDASDISFLASIGIRLIISNAKALARRGGRMIVFGATPPVEKVLYATGVGDLTTMVATRAEADAALAAAGA